jgi:hypothetical protein
MFGDPLHGYTLVMARRKLNFCHMSFSFIVESQGTSILQFSPSDFPIQRETITLKSLSLLAVASTMHFTYQHHGSCHHLEDANSIDSGLEPKSNSRSTTVQMHIAMN